MVGGFSTRSVLAMITRARWLSENQSSSSLRSSSGIASVNTALSTLARTPASADSSMLAASAVITTSAGVFAPSAIRRSRSSGSLPVVKRTSMPVSAVNCSNTGSMP